MRALIARDGAETHVIGVFFGRVELTQAAAAASFVPPPGVEARPTTVGDLPAELTVPARLPAAGAPGVVLVPGSGPVNKDEAVGPGYSVGWFRLRDGRRALLFLTRAARFVVVDTRAGFLLIVGVDEPETLVDAIRSH